MYPTVYQETSLSGEAGERSRLLGHDQGHKSSDLPNSFYYQNTQQSLEGGGPKVRFIIVKY